MAKPALQPDLISRALRAHMTLPVRTESAGHHRFLFVDHRQLQLLRTADWQVVFGRRGSGKTLLLHVLQEILEEEFERSRQIPVLLSAQDFLVSPVGFVPSDKVRALGYFQTFCEKLADDLLNRVISLLDRPGYLHVLRGKARKKRVEDLIVEIVALVQNGHSITAFNKVKKTQRSRRTVQTESGAAVGIGVDSTGLRASGGDKAGRSREREEIHEREESEAFSPRFALVRDKLIELLDELDVERLVLLIDEWSVLDTSGSSGLQPEFAECLKRAFSRSGRFCVKIATTRYQTKLNNRGAASSFRGLEMNADIFEATNLDHALLNEEELRRFYTQLLFRRLTLVQPEVGTFAARNADFPNEWFIRSMFRGEHVFDELVMAAQGLPREFVTLFNEVAKRHDFSVRPLWELSEVRRCIRERSVLHNETEYESEADQILNSAIKDRVVATGSRLFFVRRADRERLEAGLDELLEKRIVHEMLRTRVPDVVREKYDGYVIDHGLWLDWRNRSEDSRSIESYIPSVPEEADELVINGDLVRTAHLARCGPCGAMFPKTARPYVVKRLCPVCFERTGTSPPGESG